MTALTAADYADTGQWKLIMNIYTTGMEAFLENTLHPDVELQLLFSVKWENDPGNLLEHIENAVYDHPRVLDDFSASIILFDPRTLFIPTAVLDEEDSEIEIYTSLYNAEPTDILVETDRDLTATSSMAPGIKSFLKRTFPGTIISTNLMNQVRNLRKEKSGKDDEENSLVRMKKMIVTERDNEADFILLENKSLISASTHSIKAKEDIIYHVYNIIDAYGLKPDEVSIPREYILS